MIQRNESSYFSCLKMIKTIIPNPMRVDASVIAKHIPLDSPLNLSSVIEDDWEGPFGKKSDSPWKLMS